MKHLLVLLLLTTPVSAATFNISVDGTLVEQKNEFWPELNTGVDPNLSVGSLFTLSASFDASLLLPYGDNAFIVGLYGMPTTGPSFFRIDAPGMTWQSTDDLEDGQPFSLAPREAWPAIIIQGDKVIALDLNLGQAGGSDRPWLGSGSDASFTITAPRGRYGDHYNTPGFLGVWDFANSSVVDPPSPVDISSVPEPSTWAMFILGLGLIGWRKRRELHLSRV